MAMKEFTELQRTPSLNHVSAQSPRVGGCVGTFFHMFDWNPSKKRCATKRLPAERLEEEHYVRRERSLKETNVKRSLNNDETRGFVQHAAAMKNACESAPETSKASEEDQVPGVVARLMGLESLPKTSSLSSSSAAAASHVVVPDIQTSKDQGLEQEGLMPSSPVAASPPVLLQELLRQEGFKDSSRKSLTEKLPSFSRKASADQKKKQQLEGEAQRRKSSGMRARGIGTEPHVVHHPYVDPRIPRPSRRKTEETKQQSVGLSNLHNNGGGPVLLPSKSHNQLLTSSPMQSPSNLGSKHTAKLLETAAKVLEPNNMQKPSCSQLQTSLPSTQSLSYMTQSECGVVSSTKSERQGFANSQGVSALHSSSCKLSRTESMARSWNGKEEKDNDDLGEISGRMSESRSVMQARRMHGAAVSNNESSTRQQQEQASKWRFESALAAHSQAVLSSPAIPLSSKRSGPSNPRSGGMNSTNHVLGMHEASIRGFKTELGAKSLTSVTKDRFSRHSRSLSETAYVTVLHQERMKGANGIQSREAASLFGTEFLLADLACLDPPNPLVVVKEPMAQDKAAKKEVVEVVTLSSGALEDGNLDKANVGSAHLIVKPSGNGRRPPSNGGFNWGMQKGPKGRAGKQEKNVRLQDANQVVSLPEKAIGGFPIGLLHGLPPAAATMAAAPPVKSMGGSLLRYSRLFSLSKSGGKKEGQEKGEGLVMKRPENALRRRSMLQENCQGGGAAAAVQTLFTSAKQGRIQQHDGGVNLTTDAGSEQATALQSEACSGTAAALYTQSSDTNVRVNLSPHSEKETTSSSSSSLMSSCRCEGREGSVQQHMRARSIDDVFPELPMDEIISDIRRRGGGQNSRLKIKTEEVMIQHPILQFQSKGQEQGWFDCQSGDHVFGTRRLSRNFLASSEGRSPGDDTFVTEPPTFPSSPLVDYDDNTALFPEREIPTSDFQQHFFIMDSNSSTFTGEVKNCGAGGKDSHKNLQNYFQGPRTDAAVVSDDDNDDEESVGADLDTCSTRAVCDASSTPDRLEIQKMHLDAGWSEDAVSPNLLKKFDEDTTVSAMHLNRPDCQLASLGLVVDECGQPSPVSVLESHFLDESPTTTPDASLTEPEQQLDEGLEDMRSYGVGLIMEEAHEKKYICEILEASLFWESKDVTSSSNWVVPPIPALLDASLFAKLEFGNSSVIGARELSIMKSKLWGEKAASYQFPTSSWQSNRKLLFDAVNEALALQFEYQYSACEPWMNVRMSSRPRIFGPRLAAEIYRKLCEWRERMTADDLVDYLIDRDMSVAAGKWTDFSQEVVEVGLHIERMLLKSMIEELVDELHHLQTRSSLQPLIRTSTLSTTN
ncbi:hypothetical protein BDL97_16G078500 [Sphagnum fallax]|nr:hypothetical protein BDL97_16G078500 [Sphagnum fallax]